MVNEKVEVLLALKLGFCRLLSATLLDRLFFIFFFNVLGLRFYFWLLVVLNFDLELGFARAAHEFDVMFKLACSWENL